jgi:hypothetical protein
VVAARARRVVMESSFVRWMALIEPTNRENRMTNG